MKWHGRVTFPKDLLSIGDCSTDRRAGTGMRLGEFCTLLRRGEDKIDLDADLGAGPGVVGVAGTEGSEGQSSERLSSHGWLLIFLIRFVMI